MPGGPPSGAIPIPTGPRSALCPTEKPRLNGLNLDWKRFVSHRIQDFCREEIHAVLKYSVLPVTINMMEFFKPLDYEVSRPSWILFPGTPYPDGRRVKGRVDIAVRAAACHTLMRSLKGAFPLMEAPPSIVELEAGETRSVPACSRLSSLQAVACATAQSASVFPVAERAGEARKNSSGAVGES